MPLEIPVSNEDPFFKQTTNLDGRDYILRFQYNQRMCCWYMSIFDEDDEPITVGRRLSEGVIIGRHVRDERMPPGQIMVIDMQSSRTEGPRDPGRYDLGTRHRLAYFTESELAA